MQELEKIIEKMKEIKDGNRKEKLYAKYPPNSKDQEVLNAYSQGYEDGTDNFYNATAGIIRKRMNDGWIPVEERMPEEYGEYLVTIVPQAGYLWAKRIIANFSDLMGIVKKPIFYTGEVGKIDFEDITDMVIAWRPLPEPYISRNQNKPEERYPEWRAKFLNKFDRRE